MGGHVEVMFSTINSAINHVREGRLKALGVTTKGRVPSLPNVPSLVEQGFTKNQSSSWQGILVPAGTPEPIVQKLHAAIVKACANPDVVKRMEEAGTIPGSSPSPAEFKAYIAQDSAKWAEVIRITGAKPE
jgi:tripartite-type tricarboxylate transporter receptor subunit TctC